MPAEEELLPPDGLSRPMKSSSLMGGGRPTRVRILDADRGLAAALEPEDLAVARRLLVTDVIEVSAGRLDPQFDPEGLLGLLLLDGLMVRCVAVGDRLSGELVGPGAVLRPWDDFGAAAPLPVEVNWRVMQPLCLARLDRRFLAGLRKWPVLIEQLTARIVERAHGLAFIIAIHCLRHVDLRLLAYLWHLADTYGRVTADGTHLPLKLSHSDLAELVGAQRPSVSVALSNLAERGSVWRGPDGTWMLTKEPPAEVRDMRRRVARTGA